jgi:hypothetical protein
MNRPPEAPDRGQPLLPFLAVLVTSLAVFAAVRLSADPDLWGHLRFGLDMLRDGSLPRRDTYSFTSTIPWMNHEWLAELAMAAAWSAGESIGLVLLKAGLVGLALASSWSGAMRAGTGGTAAWGCAGVTAFAALNRTSTFRPQVFAFCTCALLCLALRFVHGPRRAVGVLAVVVVLACWANVHGSWFLGVLIVLLWVLGRLLTGPPMGWLAAVLPCLALAASLCTPYGAANWSFLADTVGFNRPEIADWVAPWSDSGLFIVWACPTAACILAVAVAPSGRRLLPWLLPACVLGAASLRLARVDVFFGCAASALLADALAARVASVAPVARDSPAQPWHWLLAAMVGAAILGPRVPRLVANVSCIPVDRGFIEDAASGALDGSPVGTRVLTYFDYGEFALWHLSPRVLISMDGRRETVYSPATIAAHAAFYDNPSAAARYPEGLSADYVWVPSGGRFAPALAAAGWMRMFEGPLTTIWTRRKMPVVAFRGGTVPGCFPGGALPDLSFGDRDPRHAP